MDSGGRAHGDQAAGATVLRPAVPVAAGAAAFDHRPPATLQRRLSVTAVQRLGSAAGNRALTGLARSAPPPPGGQAPVQRLAGTAAGPRAFAPPAPPVAPRPAADKAFAKVAGEVKKATRQTKAHPQARAEAKKAQDAAVPPTGDREGQAKAARADTMAAAAKGGFDKAGFVRALTAALAAKKPKNLEEADDFATSGKADQLKTEVVGQVGAGKAAAAGDIEAKAKQPPDTAAAKEKPVTPLAADQETKPPTPAFAQAMPPKAPSRQTDLSGAKHETDATMRDADVSEGDLKRSNEPEMVAALDAKKQGEQHSAEAPKQVRAHEAATLGQARQGATGAGRADLAAMVSTKKGAVGKVRTAKAEAKAKDEARRAGVTGKVTAIFDRTKVEADAILGGLDAKVASTFDAGEAEAKRAFTTSHETAMRRYKADRYDGVLGGAKWLKDKVMGMPSEVNAFYEQAKGVYVARMTALAHRLADLIDGELTRAKQRIQQGRDEIKAYVTSLPRDLQKVGADAAQSMEERFATLESDVEAKGAALQEDLASKYTAAMEKVNADIEAMQAANKGLWDAVKEAVGGAIAAILKLKGLFLGILSKVASAFKKIVADPIGFIGNFLTAVKNGFLGFASRIGKHLKEGLQGWLFGKLGEAGIDIPDTLDLKGILKMVLSMLGLTWANLRSRLVKRIGEKAMGVLEGTVDVFRALVTEGPMGLWKWIVDKVGDLKDLVMGQIRGFVIEKIVKAGITWVLGMLNPAGALIKIVQTLVNVVQWIMEKGAALVDLVQSIVGSIHDIAFGGMGGVPEKIEAALAKAVPVVISFLASLLGLGGISEKVRSILAAVQKPVTAAIDAVIGGALKLAGPMIAAAKGLGRKAKQKFEQGKAYVKDKAGQAREWVKQQLAPTEKTFTMSGASHRVIARGDKPVAEMASVRGRLAQKIGSSMGSLKKRERALGSTAARTASESAELRQIPTRIKDLQELRRLADAIEGLQDSLGNADEHAVRGPEERRLDAALNRFCELAARYGDRYRVTDIVPLNDVSPAEEAEIRARAGAVDQKGFTRFPGQGIGNAGPRSLAADAEAEKVAIALERSIGAAAISHGRTQAASDAMAHAAKRYLEEKAGEPWKARAGRIDALLLKTGESNPAWSGTVGTSIDDIRAVFDGGNINERITHIEAFNKNILMPDLATANEAEFEANLARMEAAGLDRAAVEARRDKSGVAGRPQDAPYDPNLIHSAFAAPSAAVVPEGGDLRQQPQSRMWRGASPSDRRAGDEGTILSDREQRLHEASTSPIDPTRTWQSGDPVLHEEGMRLWLINERNKWVAALRKINTPVGAGPSGSTNTYLQIGRMLGVTDAVGLRLACIAALVPTRHHTLVEVLTGAAAQGLPFTPGLRMYRDIRPLSEQEIRSMAPGGRFPDEVAAEAAAASAAVPATVGAHR